MKRLTKNEQQSVMDLIDSRLEYYKTSADVMGEEDQIAIVGKEKAKQYIKDCKTETKLLRVIKKKLGYN